MRTLNRERVASCLFFLAGIYGFLFSLHLPLGRWNEPGPGVFPLSLSVLLCLSGFLWFFYGKKQGGEEKRDWHETIRKLKTPAKIVMLTAAFILTLDRLGYLAASSLYMVLLFLWVSRYRFWIAMGLAILLGGGSWYFFAKVLAIQLPRGIWSL